MIEATTVAGRDGTADRNYLLSTGMIIEVDQSSSDPNRCGLAQKAQRGLGSESQILSILV
jgi:hypothetical protein